MKTIRFLPLLAVPFLMGAAADPLTRRLDEAERRITALEKANAELRSKLRQGMAGRNIVPPLMKRWSGPNQRHPRSPYLRLPYHTIPSPHHCCR